MMQRLTSTGCHIIGASLSAWYGALWIFMPKKTLWLGKRQLLGRQRQSWTALWSRSSIPYWQRKLLKMLQKEKLQDKLSMIRARIPTGWPSSSKKANLWNCPAWLLPSERNKYAGCSISEWHAEKQMLPLNLTRQPLRKRLFLAVGPGHCYSVTGLPW